MAVAAVLSAGAAALAQQADLPFRVSTIDGVVIDCTGVTIDSAQRVTLTDAGAADGQADVKSSLALDELAQIVVRGAPPASQPEPGRLTFFLLTTASEIRGAVAAPAGTAGPFNTVQIDAGLTAALNVPLSQVAAILFSSSVPDAARADFDRRRAERQRTRDMLLTSGPEGVIAFPGALERLTKEGWQFSTGGRMLSGGYDRALGVILASADSLATVAPAMVHTHHRGKWPGRIESADSSKVRVVVAGGDSVAVPWTQISRIELRSGRVMFLSDLEPLGAAGEGFFGTPWPWMRDRSVTGQPLRIAGRAYARGIGVHSRSRLTFAVPEGFTIFGATIGIDDDVREGGDVVFRVLSAGRPLFDSGPVRRGDRPRDIQVDLAGAKQILLEVDFGASLDIGDHANWANARFLKD